MKKGRTKTRIIFASLLGIVLILFFTFKNYNFHQGDNLLNKLQCMLFEKNTISVTGENIDINKITIELIEYSQGVVFKNGKKVKRIRNEHGGDNFKVFYDGLLIAQAGIFRSGWWHTHDFFFHIIKNDSTFDFRFQAKGLDEESLYYKIYTLDKLNQKSISVFYNDRGKSGQINIDYYDNNGNIIVGEIWVNDTLVSLNLYREGNWYKNYSTDKYSKTAKYKLIKEPHCDSLKYIYQIIENEKIENEIIAIKNRH